MRRTLSTTQPQQNQYAGFSLIELLVVIAIVAILLSLAVPQYNQYVARAQFLEVVLAASPYKIAAEVAVSTQGAAVSDLNAGEYGIPDAIDASEEDYVASISMQQGVIRVVSKNILSDDETQPTYELAARVQSGRVSWRIEETSACLVHSLCSQ